jgi:small-conductance mechanosensitive channel
MIKHKRANEMTIDLIKAGAQRVVESAHAQPRTWSDFVQFWHLRSVTQRALPVIFEQIGFFMTVFGITTGSVLVAFIVYRLILCVGFCCRREKARVTTRWIKNAEGKAILVQQRNKTTDDLEWQAATGDPAKDDPVCSRLSKTTAVHFVALLLRVLIILLGIYVGCSAVGFDVIPVVTSLGIVALVVSFAARDLIVNSASTFYIFLSGILQEGMYITTQHIRGKVMRIHSLHTQVVERNGPMGAMVIHVIPNSHFISYIVSRIVSLEHGAETLRDTHPAVVIPDAKRSTNIDPRLTIGESLVPRRVAAI